MKRQELKALIKECLVEILSEGLGGSLDTPISRVSGMSESRMTRPRGVAQRARQFDPSLDVPIGGRTQTPIAGAVKAVAGGNKVMESIFADTAATTLQQQMQNEGRSAPAGGSHYERIVDESEPADLFGEEAAGRWADLAFAPMPRNSRSNNPLDS